MNMPLRPLDAHGQRFTTSAPFEIIAWLQSEGFTLAIDQPGLVELARNDERIRIDQAGQITPLGDQAARTAKMLLLHSEEKNG